MTVATTPARRLLALLEDEQALENRPLEDVLADLDAHGVDAGAAIRLARQLAERNRGPAAALLGAVIEDEAAEAEIAALETASIDEVRERLDAGTVAAIAAEAKRRAGLPSNVVGLRRRRSAAWTWAGSLVGMAACALIVVAVWWPADERIAPAPAVTLMEVAPPPADLAVEAEAPPTQRDVARTAPQALSGLSGADGGGQSALAPATVTVEEPPVEPIRRGAPTERAQSPDAEAPAAVAEVRPLDAPEAAVAEPTRRTGGLTAVPADGDATRDTAAAAATRPEPPLPPRPPGRAAAPAPAVGMTADAPAERSAIAAGDMGEAAGTARSEVGVVASEDWIGRLEAGVPERGLAVAPLPAEQAAPAVSIIEFQIIDPLIMPSQAVPAFAQDRVERGLSVAPPTDRLAEVLAAAAGRHLVALVTVREAAEVYDSVIVLRDPAAEGPPPGARDPVLVMVYGDRAEVFERIRLPPKPQE